MYQYQVSFSEAVRRAFSNYCNFTGRASRSEFWWFYLFNAIITFPLAALQTVFEVFDGPGSGASIVFNVILGLYGLGVFLPQLGLCVRRLHDIGKSGWNYFWGIIPFVGWIILLVFWLRDSEMADNQYGPVPNIREIPGNPYKY